MTADATFTPGYKFSGACFEDCLNRNRLARRKGKPVTYCDVCFKKSLLRSKKK